MRRTGGRWVAVALLASVAVAGEPEITRAEQLFRRTQYDQSLRALQAENQQDVRILALIGKNQYMLGEFRKATEMFERAAEANPKSSEYFHWLGRAWGRRAETSNPFSAPGYASRARQAFEKSVELNPRNTEAVNDLFSYYLEAPGFLGGGLDKATRLTERIRELDPVEYHYAMSEIAQKRKEYSSAEQHLRRAVELAPRQVGRIVDLAKFLARRGKVAESEAALAQAEQIAPNSPKVLFARARVYVEGKRNLPQARELLQKYLNSPLSPDDPPREEARKLLRQAQGS